METGNFSEANLLTTYSSMFEDKSFNPYYFMYKGTLQNGQDIAIARYCDSRYEECMNEASILVKFEHENVMQLLGYCIDGGNVFLLYDIALETTLADLLFHRMHILLDWNDQNRIILGVARVLAYLHNHAPVRIIHGDVKPLNILLDESFHPKLSGFGLATAINETDCIHVDRARGTMGYMAPEYLSTSWLSTKADVYSFGLLVLATVTRQRVYDLTRLPNYLTRLLHGLTRSPYDEDIMLSGYVKRNWLEGTLSDIIDPRVDVDSALMTKLIEIGLLCVQTDPTVRPTMKEVVDMLLGTASLTFHVSEMRAWLLNPEPVNSDGNDFEGSDTGEVEEFISELCPR